MEFFTIGQIAEKAGMASSAIRYYEQLGLVDEAPRVSGMRRYSLDAVKRLKLIQSAQGAGFSLDEIKTLTGGFPEGTKPAERWQVLAREKLRELEALEANIQSMKRYLNQTLACRCESLEDCADGNACARTYT